MVAMAETYCGKSCENCTEKLQLACPGCRLGPGRAYSGECSIAKCCTTRGHQSCEYCATASTCYNRKSSFSAAENRIKMQEADASARAHRVRKSKLLGTWLMLLFWLVIVTNIVSVVFSLVESLPGMTLLAQIISTAFSVAYALILLKLSSASHCFRMAGICYIIAAVFNFATAITGSAGLASMIELAALVPSFIAMYQEYIGYAEVTEAIDADMGRKWGKLWYWALGSLLAMGAGMIFTLFGSLLGALAALASLILTVVVSVIKIVYLYRTAKMFREYAEEN